MSESKIRDYAPAKETKKPLWKRVGLPANQGATLRKAIENGLPVDVMRKVAAVMRISQTNLLVQAGISARTVSRRKEDGKLSAAESERIARYVRVMEAAAELMGGDVAEAYAWLNEPAVALGGETPAELIATETGANDVMQLIGRIRHGVFS